MAQSPAGAPAGAADASTAHTAHVEQVMLAMFNKSTVMRQNDALQWMLKYTDEQSAWATFSSLLRSPSLVVQFSAANGLYAKVRRGWGRLSADARPALAATLWRALFDLAPVLLRGLEAGGDPELGTKLNTVQRLAMTVASVALFVPKGVDSLVQQVGQLVSQATTGNAFTPVAAAYTASLILRAVAEELDVADLSRGRAHEVKQSATTHLGTVVQLLASCVATPSSPLALAATTSTPTLAPAHAAVWQCMAVWVPLGITPGVLAQRFEPLCAALAAALGAGQFPEVVTQAADCAAALLEEHVQPPEGAARAAFVDRIVAAVLAMKPMLTTVLAPPAPGAVSPMSDETVATVARAIISVCVTLGEQCLEWLAAGSPQALDIAKLLLAATAAPDLSLATSVLDFWTLLQDIPVAERAPPLRQPVFAGLVPVLVRQIQHPRGYTVTDGWGSVTEDIDSEVWEQFRGGYAGVDDVLGSAFSLLQSSFVAQLLDMLPVSMDPRAALARNPDQWRVQEAVFVCLQAVSREAGDLLNTGAPERQHERAALAGYFRTAVKWLTCFVPVPDAKGEHPGVSGDALLVLEAGCQWLATLGDTLRTLFLADTSLFQATLDLLAQALCLPVSGGGAAAALHAVCTACAVPIDGTPAAAAVSVCDVGVMKTLCDTKQRAATAGLPRKHRCTVASALCVALVGLPADIRAQVANTIAGPIVTRLGAALSNRAQVLNEMTVLGCLLKSLTVDGVAAEHHPAYAVLQTAWAVLVKVAGVWLADTEVAELLVNVYRYAVGTLKTLLAPLLVQLDTSVLTVYSTHRYAVCLEYFSAVMEHFGKNEQAAPHMAHIVTSVAATTFELVKTGVARHPDVVCAFFTLLDSAITTCPATLLGSPAAKDALGMVLMLATAAIPMTNRAPVRSVSMFATHLCLWGEAATANGRAGARRRLRRGTSGVVDLTPFKAVIDAALAVQGAAVVSACVASLVAPRDAHTTAAANARTAQTAVTATRGAIVRVLHAVMAYTMDQGKAWFGTALRHHAVAARAQFSATYPDRTATDGEAGLACFTDADLAGTVELLHRSARGNAAQFRLIVTDLARVCAHETTKDEVQMHLAVPLASSAKGSGAGTRGASEVIVLD